MEEIEDRRTMRKPLARLNQEPWINLRWVVSDR
jgi:hypothetical protein